ncbi:MAG: hypothetical protein O0V67_04920, partial [Methanocorpusculum sp.]|nr:hypothetical protein [Methanocorpusculum sp.]
MGKISYCRISDSPLFFIFRKITLFLCLQNVCFAKNGFAKGKNERATTAVQEYFLFAWLYY